VPKKICLTSRGVQTNPISII